MGTIQSNFNKLLGITAGAIGTAKHMQAQSMTNKTTALNQYENYMAEEKAFKAEQESVNKEQASVDTKMAKNIASSDKLNQRIKEQGFEKPGQSLYRKALEKSYNALLEKQELLRGRKATLDERASFLKEKTSNVKSLLAKAKIKNLKVGGNK